MKLPAPLYYLLTFISMTLGLFGMFYAVVALSELYSSVGSDDDRDWIPILVGIALVVQAIMVNSAQQVGKLGIKR